MKEKIYLCIHKNYKDEILHRRQGIWQDHSHHKHESKKIRDARCRNRSSHHHPTGCNHS